MSCCGLAAGVRIAGEELGHLCLLPRLVDHFASCVVGTEASFPESNRSDRDSDHLRSMH